MRTSVLFSAKIIGFFEIYGMSAWTRGRRGLSQCGQGKRVKFFAILCGRLLWAALYYN